jgi:cytochrome-b5 reductase
MLLSRELKVKHVEQVNHDTKRITFELPGGKSEISGVPASCM